MSTYEDEADLDTWLATEDTHFLECRRWGHAWVEFRFTQDPEPGVLSRTVLRCSRCRQKSVETLDAQGFNERYIDYDPAYRAPNGIGHLTRASRAELRKEVDRRKRRPTQPKRGRS